MRRLHSPSFHESIDFKITFGMLIRSVGAVYDVSWTVSEGPGSGYQNFCKKLIAWQFQPLRAACSYIFISEANVLICR
jgi:hypothetical protein